MDHCEELQSFVADLKGSMEKVMSSLSGIEGEDQNLKTRLEGMETRYRKDITDIMSTIHGLKEELGAVTDTVRQLQRQQNEMNQQVLTWLQSPIALEQKIDAAKSMSVRRSRSVDVILADHDSGIHSTNGGALTDPSSSPRSGHTSPTSNADSPMTKGDVVGQNRSLTSSLKRQLFPSYSTPLLCLDLTSDKEREDDSDLESATTVQKRMQQFQQTGGNGRGSTVVRRVSRKASQNRHSRQNVSSNRADAENERTRIISEILSSERAYCNRLWHMQANICEPLKEANLVTQKDLNVLFPHELKVIYEQHCVFLHKMQTRLSSWEDESEVSMAEIFRPQFEARGYLASVYADYASSFSKITDTFKDNFLKNTDLIRFLKSRILSRQAKDLEADLRLDDFLIMPLDRVSYYISALKVLLQSERSEDEKEHLSAVISHLEEVASEINGCIKKALDSNNAGLSPDRGDQSDSSNSRTIKKRYSKKQSAVKVEGSSAVLNRTDSAARRARSAAALAKRQLQQQLQCVQENIQVPSKPYVSSSSIVQGTDFKSANALETSRTLPRRNLRQDRYNSDLGLNKETQERFLTFGRGDTMEEKSAPTGLTAEKAPVRSSTSVSISALDKSKYENYQSEPDFSQATSTSGEDASQLRTSDEAGSDKMPISIKEPRRESSPPPMPVLKERSRRYTTNNVVPISYTHTNDFDTWHNENYVPEPINYRSTSLSPSRSVSMKVAPNDHYANEMANMRKVKYAKTTGTSGKNVHSFKNSLAAFFSKRKNEQRFGTNGLATPTSTLPRVPGGTSYSYWPGSYGDSSNSEVGSVRSTTTTLASNPNVRLLAGTIPRPQYIPSPKKRQSGQPYGFDYRRESYEGVQSGMAQRRNGEGAFVTNSPLYWWHKEKVPFEQHGSSSDFVEV